MAGGFTDRSHLHAFPAKRLAVELSSLVARGGTGDGTYTSNPSGSVLVNRLSRCYMDTVDILQRAESFKKILVSRRPHIDVSDMSRANRGKVSVYCT